MTSIDDKIKLFRDLVYNKIREEKKAEIEEIDNLSKDKVQKLKEELEIKEKEAILEANKKANLKAQELIAREKLIKQHAILKLKEEIIEEVVDSLYKKLEEYTNEEEYRTGLKANFKEALGELSKGSYVIYLSLGDIQKNSDSLKEIIDNHKDIKAELKPATEDIIGGFIIENSDGRGRIDNSLLAKLKDSRENIGIKVTERLK